MSELLGDLTLVLGLIPLWWLVFRWGFIPRAPRPSRAQWLIAAAYAVSFVADVAGLHGYETLAGNLYPLSQAGLIALALLPWGQAEDALKALLVVSVVAICWRGVAHDDVLLNTVAGLLVAGLALRVRGRLRLALLVSFGLGTVLWWWLAAEPNWWSWSAYQMSRVAGTVLFCVATCEG